MNALTIAAPRRRNQVVILNALSLRGKYSTPMHVRLARALAAKCTPTLLNRAGMIAGAAAACVGAVADSVALLIPGAITAALCIFFVAPAVGKGGAL